jgi:hypothetical protein
MCHSPPQPVFLPGAPVSVRTSLETSLLNPYGLTGIKDDAVDVREFDWYLPGDG